MKKECRLIMAAIGVVLFLVSMQSALADLTNGSFTTDLTGWSVESGVVQHTTVGGGKAEFIQDDDDEDLYSILTSQLFALDPESLTLSFEREMQSIIIGGDTDEFRASLLDSGGLPLVSVSGGTHFYSLNSSGIVQTATTGVSVAGNTVSLDVSSWANTYVELVFALKHDYDDELWTTVLLDNVSVSVVPVPGAFVLGSLGLSLAGWRLRKRRAV